MAEWLADAWFAFFNVAFWIGKVVYFWTVVFFFGVAIERHVVPWLAWTLTLLHFYVQGVLLFPGFGKMID